VFEPLLWHYGNLSLYRYVLKISAYALCSDSRNFFVVYRILANEKRMERVRSELRVCYY
jgi:hypothetical protein